MGHPRLASSSHRLDRA